MSKRQNNNDLIISLYLLLSGDIHQCPGPETALRGNLPTKAQIEEAISHLQLAAVESVDLVNGLSLGLLDVVLSNVVSDAASGNWQLQEMPGANAAVNSRASGYRVPRWTSMWLQCAAEAAIPNPSRHQALEGTRTGRLRSMESLAPGGHATLTRLLPGGGEEADTHCVCLETPVVTATKSLPKATTMRSNNLVFTKEQISVFASKGLHCFHLNIRSLLPKITEVRELARKIKASILCFSETWLDSYITDSKVEIENFVIVRKDRNRQGGRVCIFVRSDIDFNLRQDLDNVNLEAVWIDIFASKKQTNFVWCCL